MAAERATVRSQPMVGEDTDAVIEVLPGVGITMPDGAAVLSFGMTAEKALDLLEAAGAVVHWSRQCMSVTMVDYQDIRDAHDAWLAGVLFDGVWSFEAAFDDVALSVAGGGPGHADHLARIEVSRIDRFPAGPALNAVVWQDIDLFGYPASEVEALLPGPSTDPIRLDVHVEALGLILARSEWAGADKPITPRNKAQHRLHTSARKPYMIRIVLLDAVFGGWERCCAGRLA